MPGIAQRCGELSGRKIRAGSYRPEGIFVARTDSVYFRSRYSASKALYRIAKN
jgi:hypothetical protein